MAGRILGWLLICDPPEQSATELAAVLHASKGSISSATRLLLPSGLVQRISHPGERRDYFAIRPEAWAALVRTRLAEVVAFRELTERGLDLLTEAPKERRERLEEVHELYAWLAHELPELWQRWEERRA